MVENQGFEPRMPEATDLQSAEVTNASRSPYMAPRGGLEPPTCGLTVRRSTD